ncbi:MAG: serine hydrolase [Myxococcota bacterium]
MSHQTRTSPSLALLALLAVGCDDVRPSDDRTQPLADQTVAAPSSVRDVAQCEPGTHPRITDPALDGVIGMDLSADQVECIPDSSCDALDCARGECLEEGGVAACACPAGYDGQSCDQCAPGYALDDVGQCQPDTEPPTALTSESNPVAAISTVSTSGHRVQWGNCGGGAGCADEIPMTGTVSPLLREVDIAMAQFVKTRCIGSAVLSISRNGRRIYKRGFGRFDGSSTPGLAHCPEDNNYNASSDYTLPDTPHQVGSVSKYITASVVRDMIADRIQQRGLGGVYSDPTEALVLDPDLELLPTHLLRVLDQTRPDSLCPPVSSPGACARAGCGGNGPDTGWQQMTVGDLLSHTAGLTGAAIPSWDSSVITQTAALRGYNSWGDWDDDHDDLRARTKVPGELDDARDYVANALGVSANNVFFVSTYNAIDGEDPLDESLEIAAGRCLSHTPVGQTATSPNNTNFGYQNGAYSVLQRIAAHLHGESGGADRFSSPNGFPELHDDSALATFLEQHGLEDGVIAEHSIQSRVTGRSPGLTDPVPSRREYSGGEYLQFAPNKNRPFCVWNGASCSFTAWSDDTDNSAGLRLPWDFEVGYWTWENGVLEFINQPRDIPHYYNTEARNPGVGGLMVEAPALLRVANLYYARSTDVRQGAWRDTCTNCGSAGQKGGDMGGARARVRQTAGGTLNLNMPPRNGANRLTTSPDPANWTAASWSEPSGVDFVVAVSQSADEAQAGGYTPERYVSYALSDDRVDWDAVDEMIEGQARRVVGMAMNSSSNTYLWFEDDHREAKVGNPGVPGVEATAPANYALPSTRIGSDIVGVGIAPNDRVYTWYDDGHVSVGISTDLDHHTASYAYSLPPGQAYEDIVAIAISSESRTYSWYRDGTRAIGYSADLDYYGVGDSDFELPPGQTADEIAGIAIDWAHDDRVWTRFRDGSIAEGSSWHLDVHGYDRGRVAAMTMHDGDTTLWFANGYMRRMAGSPADNMVTPTILESRQYSAPAGYEPSQIVGAAQTAAGTRFWWATEETSWGLTAPDPMTYPGWPSTGVNMLLDVARNTSGDVYSWFNTEARAQGDIWDLGATAIHANFDLSQHPFLVEGIAIDSGPSGDGFVWTLYSDGAVSRGRTWDLGEAYWSAP